MIAILWIAAIICAVAFIWFIIGVAIYGFMITRNWHWMIEENIDVVAVAWPFIFVISPLIIILITLYYFVRKVLAVTIPFSMRIFARREQELKDKKPDLPQMKVIRHRRGF